MAEKEAFPSAYSSFAVSVDSRNAERPSYSTPANESNSGILRQTRPTSAYGFHEKKRSLSPKSQDRFDSGKSTKPGVRFTKDVIHEYTQREASPLHHRRSSTAAFIDYIRTHLPESHNGGSLALTPKRALVLFAVSGIPRFGIRSLLLSTADFHRASRLYEPPQIVFSATYLALGLLPLLAGIAGFGSPVTVVIRRSDGYYGNSHIFRGGENLADPHMAGDEHHHYLAHAANAQAGDTAGNVNVKPKQKTLRTSTLAEEATMKEIRVARAKAKADALARAQLLAAEDEDDEVEEIMHEPVIVEEVYKAPEDARRRRPLMPLKKLAEKGKAERQARLQSETKLDDSKRRAPVNAQKQGVFIAEHAVSADGDGEDKEEELATEQDETELEGIIAKLRQEALDRRLSKIHRAQKDAKVLHHDNGRANTAKERAVNDEARLRRPGIVKSPKISTKEE